MYLFSYHLWKGCSARFISGFKNKFIWSGVNSGFGDVDILLNENWTDTVISVVRLNYRIMSIRILVEKLIINIFRVYGPQTGLSDPVEPAQNLHRMVITAKQLHSTKPELRHCAGSKLTSGVPKIRDGEDL